MQQMQPRMQQHTRVTHSGSPTPQAYTMSLRRKPAAPPPAPPEEEPRKAAPSAPYQPSFALLALPLIAVRLFGELTSPITDCDETFNCKNV